MRLTDAEAAEFSPIRFLSPGDAPSLIVHRDPDTAVPMVEGETMYAALGQYTALDHGAGIGAGMTARV